MFGGKPEEHLPYHQWMDATKAHFADVRHRAMRHHSEGIDLALSIFGQTIEVTVRDAPRKIPLRPILERHVIEDLGHIPTMADWLREMPMRSWMVSKAMARPDKGKLRAIDKPWSYDPFDEQATASKRVALATQKVLGDPDDPGP